jgi:hypothetical protein
VQKERRRNDAAAHTPIQGIWSTAPRFRLPPRQTPQDQYAGGILSLSENNRSLFGFCGEIPMKAGGGATKVVFHSRRDLELDADTAQRYASIPVEDGSLSV